MKKNAADELAKDIATLRAFRRARLDFNTQIAGASSDQSELVLAVLRTEAAYQIAEFYFLLQGDGIPSPDDFDALLERHNQYVSTLLADGHKMIRMGLTSERLLAAIFDGETKPRVLKLWSDDPGTIDQSSLGRLLVTVMSDETARKTLVAFGKGGLLIRQPSVFRLILVRSPGVIERVYGKCLRDVRNSIRALT
jgi:hypothetical protein